MSVAQPSQRQMTHSFNTCLHVSVRRLLAMQAFSHTLVPRGITQPYKEIHITDRILRYTHSLVRMVRQLQQTPWTLLQTGGPSATWTFTALILDSDDAHGTSLSKAHVWRNSTISVWLETPPPKGNLAKTSPSKQTCGFLSNSGHNMGNLYRPWSCVRVNGLRCVQAH